MTTRPVLTNVLILRKVLKNLTARELNTCCKVCKLWNDEAWQEKASRYQMHWDTFVLAEGSKSSIEEFWNCVNSFINKCPVEPVSAWIFCSESLYCEVNNFEDDFDSSSGGRRKRKKKTNTEQPHHPLLPSALPLSCKAHISFTDGVIGTDRDMKTHEYDEYDMAMTIILFGGMWKLQVLPFCCTHAHCQSMIEYWAGNSKVVPACFTSLRKLDVKMLNLFCMSSGIYQEIGYSLLPMFNWPLVAGGNVCSRFLRDGDKAWTSDRTTCRISGVAVVGQGVQVASVLIRSPVDAVSQVEALMKELADHNLPLERSFGLMYACIGRGTHVYYGEHNVESKCFRKYFPNTPLFGFFGNGEIGFNYPEPDPLHVSDNKKSESLSSSEEESEAVSRAVVKRQIAERREKEKEYKMKHPPKLTHAYTTVMCLVSIPK